MFCITMFESLVKDSLIMQILTDFLLFYYLSPHFLYYTSITWARGTLVFFYSIQFSFASAETLLATKHLKIASLIDIWNKFSTEKSNTSASFKT